jgi:hypothetical protein
MKDDVPSRPRLAAVLTVTAFLVALACFLLRVFWWTHHQFLDCALPITGTPQPWYCGVVPQLEWCIWYGPLVSLTIALIVLRMRRQSWHSSPFAPVVVFWSSVLMLFRTVFVLLIGFFLGNLH